MNRTLSLKRSLHESKFPRSDWRLPFAPRHDRLHAVADGGAVTARRTQGIPMTESSPAEDVLMKATAIAGGDAARARDWFFAEALADFGGVTAADLVAQNRASDVIAYLDSLDAGPAG